MKRKAFFNLFTNRILKVSVILFFIFGLFINIAKADTVPSDITIATIAVPRGTPITHSFDDIIGRLIYFTLYNSNKDIKPGAYSENVKNIRSGLETATSTFNEAFIEIKKNTNNLGLEDKAQDEIIAKLLSSRILYLKARNISNLKSQTKNTDEVSIFNDLLNEIKYNNFITEIDLNSATTTEFQTKYKEEIYQLGLDNKVINATKQNTTVNTDTEAGSLSYISIIDNIKEVIGDKIDDQTKSFEEKVLLLKNADIVTLIKSLDDSIQTASNSLNRLKTSSGSNNDIIILQARIEGLTPVKNLIDNYLNDPNNKKPENTKVINVYTEAQKEINSSLERVTEELANKGKIYDPTNNSFTNPQIDNNKCNTNTFMTFNVTK